MKPVYQTKTQHPEGNCFEACLASILELPLVAIPPAIKDRSAPWDRDIHKWLWERNFGLICLQVLDWHCLPPGYAIAGVQSPRGDWLHAIVVHADGWEPLEQVHDPFPGATEPVPLKDWRHLWYLTVLDGAGALRVAGSQEAT